MAAVLEVGLWVAAVLCVGVAVGAAIYGVP